MNKIVFFVALSAGLLLTGCTAHSHDRRYDPYTDNRKTLYLLERERRLNEMRPPVQRPMRQVCGQYLQSYTSNGRPVYRWECRYE